ncbi:hypothetical protein GCM10027168_44200 [Streptomyces capparidis]
MVAFAEVLEQVRGLGSHRPDTLATQEGVLASGGWRTGREDCADWYRWSGPSTPGWPWVSAVL